MMIPLQPSFVKCDTCAVDDVDAPPLEPLISDVMFQIMETKSPCVPTDRLSTWLSNMLSRERISLSAMIETHHAAMMDGMRDLLKCVDEASMFIDKTMVVGQHEQTRTEVDVASCTGCHKSEVAFEVGGVHSHQSHETYQTTRDRVRVSVADVNEAIQSAVEVVGDHSEFPGDRSEGPFRVTTLAKFSTQSMAFEEIEDDSDVKAVLQRLLLVLEIFISFLIGLNVIVMAMECQYTGFDLGHDSLDYRDYRPAAETWPWAHDFFTAVEWTIGSFFVLEVVVMVAILRHRYLISPWNLFDLAVVSSWLVLQFARGSSSINTTVLRAAKLMRLFRLLRLVRTIRVFDALHVILTSVKSSLQVLCWTLVLLSTMLVISALAVSQSIEEYIADTENPHSEREQVFVQWGSFSRSILTMLEVTLGNWGPPCRLLQDVVSEWWIVFFMGYKVVIGFAVVQVITSVFIQQTFKVVAEDEQVMIANRARAAEAYLKNLEHLFTVMDLSGDGHLSPEEIRLCFSDPTVRAWLEALDIEVDDACTVFALIDDGDGVITHAEFIDGIRRVKGPAKNSQVLTVLKEVRQLKRALINQRHILIDA
eukprot:TRINITY_DN3920_c2_g1_i1.p1 TRINITY_DN3920_c2_g1~~TRINITY_DN3920_c2_g1_i1.p1  ORF type:complete len:592 (+),score=81.33 TRINITY_DN3920_c2_g1_i1:61-1836(+)